MKVFTSQQMRDLEKQAYQEGASEELFMEQAGKGIAEITKDYIQKHRLVKEVLLLCAKGNNSGDAYVAGCHLLEAGYAVMALQPIPLENCSLLCQKNGQRFLNAGGKSVSKLASFPEEGLILDGLFGTGFKGRLEEPYASIVQQANDSGLPIFAIDIPSGLNGDDGSALGEVIKADETLFLGAPKKGFFLNEGWNFVGRLSYVDFGLPKKFMENAEADMIMLTHSFIKSLIPPIKRSWHKYERGYVTGLAGSPDMPGAAILASSAALSAGAGIVRLIHPEGMNAELSAAPVELVRQTYSINQIESILESMNKSSASFIGPGMGRTEQVSAVLQSVMSGLKKPCVVDADALTLLAEKEIPYPNETVLTPHHGEMMRLLGQTKQTVRTEQLLKDAQSFIAAKKVTLVLKGAPTFILQQGSPIYVNPRGDPGMATAGSGDVLTGIIASFLSHHLTPLQAAMVGVYLHAVAGEKAAKAKTSYCMSASDLITHLPEAYREIMQSDL